MNPTIEKYVIPRHKRYNYIFEELTILRIDGIDFVKNDNCVSEYGTLLKWNPKHPSGWREDISNGRKLSILAYGNFGSDFYLRKAYADHWCKCAKIAYDMFFEKRD